jgi:hypothetical protein
MRNANFNISVILFSQVEIDVKKTTRETKEQMGR